MADARPQYELSLVIRTLTSAAFWSRVVWMSSMIPSDVLRKRARSVSWLTLV